MILLIHGDNVKSSRDLYFSKRQPFENATPLPGDELPFTSLLQELGSGGFFGVDTPLFIENLLTKKKGDELAAIVKLLSEQSDTREIVLWEGKEVDKKTVTNLGKITNSLHKIPQNVFAFLDSIRPKNTKQMLLLFQESLVTNDPEMIFFLLIRQVRLLFALQTGAVIEETKRLAPWQQGKIKKQANFFSEEKLQTMYSDLFTLEKKMKTGGLTLPLEKEIDILLLKL